MMIGAIGAYSFQPYVYNTNTVSAASMNKLSKISDDVLDKKIDYSELVDESQNENPLKKGQTLDFQGMLEQQMQKGRLNAAKVMKPAEETNAAEETAQPVEEQAADIALAGSVTSAGISQNAENAAVISADFAAAGNAANGYSSYQMQQAINAYEMMMTA